jgi:hypothetical protein
MISKMGDVKSLEIEVRRLLNRVQTALAQASHASSTEEDAIKRWTYIEHLQKQLDVLREALKHDTPGTKRVHAYNERLEFLTQLMCV